MISARAGGRVHGVDGDDRVEREDVLHALQDAPDELVACRVTNDRRRLMPDADARYGQVHRTQTRQDTVVLQEAIGEGIIGARQRTRVDEYEVVVADRLELASVERPHARISVNEEDEVTIHG